MWPAGTSRCLIMCAIPSASALSVCCAGLSARRARGGYPGTPPAGQGASNSECSHGDSDPASRLARRNRPRYGFSATLIVLRIGHHRYLPTWRCPCRRPHKPRSRPCRRPVPQSIPIARLPRCRDDVAGGATATFDGPSEGFPPPIRFGAAVQVDRECSVALTIAVVSLGYPSWRSLQYAIPQSA